MCKSEECFATYLSEWLPLQTCTTRGVEFPCPSNSKDVLTRVYGVTWVKPQKDNLTDKSGTETDLGKATTIKVRVRVRVNGGDYFLRLHTPFYIVGLAR